MFPARAHGGSHVNANVLANKADLATMDTYVQRKTRALWQRLPALIYALLRCELFGINWYHLLGLDLLSMVRSAYRDYNTLHKIFTQKVAQAGLTDAQSLLDENTHRFEALLQPLREVESSVRELTKELEEFRKSGIGKAFSRASNLSHDLVTQKQAAAAQEAALREEALRARGNAEKAEAKLKEELIRMQVSKQKVEDARDSLAAELNELQDRLQAAELRAQHAESEVEALREELDTFYENYSPNTHDNGSGSPRQRSVKSMAERWFSRPDSAEERRRAEMICRKSLTERGHSMQSLTMKFDCNELVMVTADNSLYFLGGHNTQPSEGSNTMKVHKLSLQSGMVSEGLGTTGKAPQARRGHYCFFYRDPTVGPVIYVCGGVSWDGRMQFNDMHCLELSTSTWRQVVSSLPIGGAMTGSHNGPSMYLYGTSWDDGSAALCVLHSIAHARMMPAASGSGGRLSSNGVGVVSVSGSGRVVPAESTSNAYLHPAVSDWSRDGAGPLMVNDDDFDPAEATITEFPLQPTPALLEGTVSKPTEADGDYFRSSEPSTTPSCRPSFDGGVSQGRERISSQSGTFLTEGLEEVGGEEDNKRSFTTKSDASGRRSADGRTEMGGEGQEQWALQIVEQEQPQQNDAEPYYPPKNAAPTGYSRISPRPSSSALVPSTHTMTQQTMALPGHRKLASAPQRRPPRIPQAKQLPMSPIPGGHWMPHEDYRCWYQGSKALATLPGTHPPLRTKPARPDKRDFAGARYYGRTNDHERLYWASTPVSTNLPTPKPPQEWQASSIVRHIATVPTTPSPLYNTKGHEAADLVDMKSFENWNAWMQSHPDTLDASIASGLRLNGEEKSLLDFANRPRPRTAASRLLMQHR